MPVKEGELLCTMGGIIGGIQIDGDPVNPAPESLGVPPDDAPGQSLTHAIQFLDSDRILETRHCRLRGQVEPFYGIATEKQLMNGVAAQSGRVVAVGVATGN